MRRTLLASFAILPVLALGACSGKPSDASAAASAADAAAAPPAAGANAASNAPLYPDWAQAVVPPYPNASVALLVNTNSYQFQSADDPATVLGWYKSHVNAAWTADASGDVWNAKVNGVDIAVSRNKLTTGDAAKVKTMIDINRG